jgi:hypothetical protein
MEFMSGRLVVAKIPALGVIAAREMEQLVLRDAERPNVTAQCSGTVA